MDNNKEQQQHDAMHLALYKWTSMQMIITLKRASGWHRLHRFEPTRKSEELVRFGFNSSPPADANAWLNIF